MTNPSAHLRYALRQLRRTPVFALTVVFTLALGIGANAAIFSVIDTVLLRPLGYQHADRIVSINTRYVNENRNMAKIGGGDYTDLAAGTKSLEATAFYQSWEDGLEIDGHAVYTRVAYTSSLFGTVLGVEPAAGRLFSSSDESKNELLVSAPFAEEHFGSLQAAIGRPVHYDGAVRTIVGVLPNFFSFPNRSSVWIGKGLQPEIANRTAYNQRALARMRPGVTIDQLNAELAGFSANLRAAYPEDKGKAILALPLQEQLVGSVRPMLRLIMAAVAVILLIVCANIGHLQLVRSTRLQHQVALRTALGATRWNLALSAMLQAGLLALAGAAAGLGLAIPLLRAMLAMAPADLPRIGEIKLNQDVFAFCFGLSLVTMLVTAILPVWRSWHVDPATALKQDTSRGLTGSSSGALRSGLIVGEIALTFVLSVAAILLVQQMVQLSRAQVGFDTDRLLVVDSHSPGVPEAVRKVDPGLANRRMEALLDRLKQLPEVESIAAVSGVPMGKGNSSVRYAIRGLTTFTPGAKLADSDIIPISQNYFSTMRIPLLSGRGLTPQDTADAPPVVVISKALAREQFPNVDPVGQQIMSGFDETLRWTTIVGVVDDILQDSPASKPYPTFYVPIAQHPRVAADVTLVARAHNDPAALQQTLDRAIQGIDPAIAASTSTMQAEIGQSLRAERFQMLLFSSFAFISILLAAIGMYGVTAYSVAERRFEFALRFAFGADRAQVFGMVLRTALLMAGAGLAVGAVLAVGTTRLLASVLTGVHLLQVSTWVMAAGLILLITLAATLIPARRAASTSPMAALRSE